MNINQYKAQFSFQGREFTHVFEIDVLPNGSNYIETLDILDNNGKSYDFSDFDYEVDEKLVSASNKAAIEFIDLLNHA